MEARLYFSAFVLIMCAVHLVWTASARISAWWQKNVPLANKKIAIAENGAGILRKEQVVQRSDWYAFFHCSDLVGRDPDIRKTTSIDRNIKVPDRKNGGLRRANA